MSARTRTFATVLGAAALAGCGSSPPASVVTLRLGSGSLLARHPALVVRVGAHLAVQPIAGSLSPPMSANPRILAPGKWTPPSCSPSCVPFTAVAPGSTSIQEQVPCHGTRCTAALQVIPVIVKRGA